MSTLTLDKRFKNRVKARLSKYEFEGGILQDRPYRTPRPKSQGHGTLRGGPVRRQSNKTRGMVSDVSKAMRERTNYLKAPFEKSKTKDYRRLVKELVMLITGRGGKRHRAVSYFRAMIRNPMLKGQYGKNEPSTVRAKGFNRFMFDTGQLFRNIKAKLRVKRGRGV